MSEIYIDLYTIAIVEEINILNHKIVEVLDEYVNNGNKSIFDSLVMKLEHYIAILNFIYLDANQTLQYVGALENPNTVGASSSISSLLNSQTILCNNYTNTSSLIKTLSKLPFQSKEMNNIIISNLKRNK